MVTKRQQLKWLAKRFESLPFGSDSILMSDETLGYLGHEHEITNQELKQERDKMQKQQESVSVGDIYLSGKGFRFLVVDIAKAGSDCSIDMVVYLNLDATNDFPPGQKWVLELESFVRKFKLDGCGK